MFEKDLKEDVVYSITNFGVAAYGGSYRTTRHEYKLNFQMQPYYIYFIFQTHKNVAITFVF
jgi:hypothetical protein